VSAGRVRTFRIAPDRPVDRDLRPGRGRGYCPLAMNLRAIQAGLTLGLPAPAAARAPLGLLLLRLTGPWA